MKRTSDPATGAQTFTPDIHELEALGPDFALLCDQFQGLLIVLAKLRTERGHLSEETLQMGLNDVVRKLRGAVEGVGAALIREHHVAGHSLSHLAEWMNAKLSTAQGRRDRILRQNPSSEHEAWAVQRGPRDITSPLFNGAQGNRRVITEVAEVDNLAAAAQLDNNNMINPRNFLLSLLRLASPAAVEVKALFHAIKLWMGDAASKEATAEMLALMSGGSVGAMTIDGRTSFYKIPER